MDINDFLKAAKNNDILSKFEENLEIFRNISEQSRLNRTFVDIDKMLTRDFEGIRSLKTALSDLLPLSRAFELANLANESIPKLSLASNIREMLSESTKISNDWQRAIEAAYKVQKVTSLEDAIQGIQAQVARISEVSLMAQKSLFGISAINAASLVTPELGIRESYINLNLDFVQSYNALFKSISDNSINYLSFVPAVSTLPPIEFYHNSHLLKTISIPKEDSTEDSRFNQELTVETDYELEELLNLLDPSLNNPWKGSLAAINPSNPDAIRQFSISMRELLTAIIYKLAPDDAVKAWSLNPEYYHNNRPTRRARLLFICRNINYEPFSRFIEKDVDAILACNDIFQGGAHSLKPPFSTRILRDLRNRAGSSIRFLIRVWNETNDN